MKRLSWTSTHYELFEATNLLGISLWYAPPTGSRTRTPPCATRTETASVAPKFTWTVTTISSCHIRRTTFPIKYAHAAGTPPLACSAPSECVLSISSATSAGTVAEHVYVTLYCCRDASRSRRAYRTSKSWLTRSNAKGMNDLQAARTLIPRKKSCSRHAAVDDCICKETHEADGSKPKGIRKDFFSFWLVEMSKQNNNNSKLNF